MSQTFNKHVYAHTRMGSFTFVNLTTYSCIKLNIIDRAEKDRNLVREMMHGKCYNHGLKTDNGNENWVVNFIHQTNLVACLHYPMS